MRVNLTRVLAAIVRRNGRYLICQRASGKRHGGLWEFPGGKLEDGETDLEAISRELREELDISASFAGPIVFRHHDPGSTFSIEFLPVEIEGEPNPLEHEAIVWVAPEELLNYDLAPTDRAFVKSYVLGGADE